VQEALEENRGALPTNAQATKVMEPCNCPFDSPAALVPAQRELSPSILAVLQGTRAHGSAHETGASTTTANAFDSRLVLDHQEPPPADFLAPAAEAEALARVAGWMAGQVGRIVELI
jgi:hypothetical protein